jgi:hypothetical protein
MSDAEKCPVCSTPAKLVYDGDSNQHRYEPSPLSPAVLVLALDNEQVARAVSRIATPELRLALASVMLEGRPGGNDPFFTERDMRDEAEAAARCDGVAAQMRKTGTRFAEAAEFRDMASRHRKRAMRILSLLPDEVQARIQRDVLAPPAPVIDVVSR